LFVDIRLEALGFCVFRVCLIELALVRRDGGEAVVGLGMIGLEPDGLAGRGDRVIKLTELLQSFPEWRVW
jgi:hypothetical protein